MRFENFRSCYTKDRLSSPSSSVSAFLPRLASPPLTGKHNIGFVCSCPPFPSILPSSLSCVRFSPAACIAKCEASFLPSAPFNSYLMPLIRCDLIGGGEYNLECIQLTVALFSSPFLPTGDEKELKPPPLSLFYLLHLHLRSFVRSVPFLPSIRVLI